MASRFNLYVHHNLDLMKFPSYIPARLQWSIELFELLQLSFEMVSCSSVDRVVLFQNMQQHKQTIKTRIPINDRYTLKNNEYLPFMLPDD